MLNIKQNNQLVFFLVAKFSDANDSDRAQHTRLVHFKR